MKTLALAVVMTSMVGCASYDPGTYKRDGNGNVEATGHAAVEAARSSKSIRTECDGCQPTVDQLYRPMGQHTSVPHGHTVDGRCVYPSSLSTSSWEYKKNQERQRSVELQNSARDTVQREIQFKVNNKIRELFR